ncbi:MAG: MlaD family protein [Nocardioidaceae bacterium]
MTFSMSRYPSVLRPWFPGVAFLGSLALGVFATYAIFNKTFANVVHVSLKTSRVGLQLPLHADVKLRGVRVGEVRSISSGGDGARLDLALDSGEVGSIPSNVSARILPKTLPTPPYSQQNPAPSPELDDGVAVDHGKSRVAPPAEAGVR